MEVGNNQLRGLSNLILLQLHKMLPKNSKVDHSIVVWHLKQTGKVKKLDKWMPHELTKNFFKSSLSSVVFYYSKEQTMNHLSIGL